MRQIGPGPGAYLLPPTVGYKDHDVSRYRNPQYSMAGPVGGTKYTTIGPGPSYEVSRVTKYGKVSTPAFTITSRPKPLSVFKPPGPGAYSPEKCPRMKEQRPPAYTMTSRQRCWSLSQTPGPNQYPLPTTLGPKIPNLPSSAAYTMAGKHGLKPSERSPGPARYGETRADLFRQKAPKYSMSIKHLQCDRGIGPGPAGYLPRLPGCKLSPGYSFGHRTINDPYITAADNMPCKNK